MLNRKKLSVISNKVLNRTRAVENITNLWYIYLFYTSKKSHAKIYPIWVISNRVISYCNHSFFENLIFRYKQKSAMLNTLSPPFGFCLHIYIYDRLVKIIKRLFILHISFYSREEISQLSLTYNAFIGGSLAALSSKKKTLPFSTESVWTCNEIQPWQTWVTAVSISI